MQAISYTRVTLALDIVEKISEGPFKGYHELGIVKHQISLGDTIAVEHSDTMGLRCAYPGVPEDARNICWQAVELLQKKHSISQSVFLTIDKQIPVQGGLAGGSTNAATTLALLNKHWELNLSPKQLMAYGKELGMDVPFYFYGGSAFDSEATGVLRPIKNKKVYHFVLVVPPFGVSTADAYGGIDYSQIGRQKEKTTLLEKALEAQDIEGIAQNMHNDFEISVFKVHPQLKALKESIVENGALAALMSGSGSTLIGLCESQEVAKRVAEKYEKSFVVQSVL